MAAKPKLQVDLQVDDAVLERIMASTDTLPLEIIANTMNLLYNQAQQALKRMDGADGPTREYLFEVARKHSIDACALAKEAAPYLHRRQPQAVETKNVDDEQVRAMSETVREMERILSDHQRIKKTAVPVRSTAPKTKTVQ